MAKNVETGNTLRDVYRIFFRHRQKSVLFFVAVMVLTVLITLVWPKVYRSEGKLFVRLGRENVGLDATATVGRNPVVTVPQSREEELNSIVEVLKNRMLIEKVIAEVGSRAILHKHKTNSKTTAPSTESWLSAINPFQTLSNQDRAILQVKKRLKVEVARRSNILVVSYEDKNRKLGDSIVSKLMDFFLVEHARLNRTAGALSFLTDQTGFAHAELEQTENKLKDLQNGTGLVSPEEQRTHLVNRIARIEDDLLKTHTELATKEVEIRILRDTLSGKPELQVKAETTGVADDAVDDMRKQYYRLLMQEKELLSRYTEVHPEVHQVRHQITEAEKILNGEEHSRWLTKWPHGTFQEAQLALIRDQPRLSSLVTAREKLTAQLADARNELKQLNRNHHLIVDMQREIGLQETKYRQYSKSLEQARIDESLGNERISNVNVVQPARSSIKPVRPRAGLNLILGFVIGIFGSLALAILAEQLDHSFKTPEEIETQLELPMLVSIPSLDRLQTTFNQRN